MLGQYIGSILRWLLIEPKRKKKISLNLLPEPKRHVPWFHLNASTPRGLSKLIIQISCKKVNSRKLLGRGGGGVLGGVCEASTNPTKTPNLPSFYVFYKKHVTVSKSCGNCILTFTKLSYATQWLTVHWPTSHIWEGILPLFISFIPEHYSGFPYLPFPNCIPASQAICYFPYYFTRAITAFYFSSLA